LSMGFRVSVSLHPAIQATGRLTFAPAGLIPAEHTSLRWTHKRTQNFPRYFKVLMIPGIRSIRRGAADCQRKVESPQMDKRYPLHPALKHGAYSQSILLPGEDPAAFEQLHADLIAEFAPIGRLEEDIVLTIAQHVWRKQNIATYRVAERARDRRNALQPPESPQYALSEANYEELFAKEDKLQKELGESWGLLEMGQASTIDYANHRPIRCDDRSMRETITFGKRR
jgi:hypothetical protein